MPSGIIVELNEWLQALWLILRHPSAETFQFLAENSEGKFTVALIWVTIIASVNGLINILLGKEKLFLFYDFVVGIVILPFAFLLFSFCISFVARRFFHVEEKIYNQVVYILAIILIIGFLLEKVLSYIPQYGTLLRDAVLIYPVILLLMAIKTLIKLSLWKSMALLGASLLIAIPGYICGGVFLLSLVHAVPRLS